MKYQICHVCGSHLDFGEHCECQKERDEVKDNNKGGGDTLTEKEIVELNLNDILSDSEYFQAKAQAKRKLARIIEREGDANGERLKPYYISQLIYEAIVSNRFTKLCNSTYSLAREIKKEMPAAKAAGQI